MVKCRVWFFIFILAKTSKPKSVKEGLMPTYLNKEKGFSHNSRAYLASLLSIISVILICSVILFVTRVSTWVAYAQPDLMQANTDLYKAILIGFRFDLAIVIRLSIFGLLFSLALIPFSVSLLKVSWTINRYLGGLIIILTIWLSMANFSYIGFFNRPIDSFAFSGMNYGIETILPTVTSLAAFEFRILICLIVTWISFWLYKRIGIKILESSSIPNVDNRWFLIVGIVAPVIVLMALGRGTVSTFPLSQRHLVISSETAINNIVPNGIVALYYGYREFRQSDRLKPASDLLGRSLFESFYGYPPSENELFPQFFTRTKKSIFLEENPPHVVLNLVESMANAMLNPAFTDGIDLAGKLRPHLATDLYFSKFLPAHDDTQKSLMSIMINTEYSSISHSSHQHTPLRSSAARVFKDAGYKTIFVYAGFEGLSNRSEYLKTQGFDEFIGAHQLSTLYPSMEKSVWGGEDKFVFNEVFRHLKSHKKPDAPLFIVTLTVTNHPPYELPEGYELQLPEVSKDLQARLQDLPPESLNTFLYSNDQVGSFISDVKATDLKDKTIIAVTGDHAIRGMRFDNNERLNEISVPLYIYIPTKYHFGSSPNMDQIASHKDIMPTLYNSALSNVSYLNLGRNLLEPTNQQSIHNFAYHADYLITNGYSFRKNGETLMNGRKIVEDFKLASDQSLALNKMSNAEVYSDILSWITRFQLLEEAVN